MNKTNRGICRLLDLVVVFDFEMADDISAMENVKDFLRVGLQFRAEKFRLRLLVIVLSTTDIIYLVLRVIYDILLIFILCYYGCARSRNTHKCWAFLEKKRGIKD